MSVINGNNMAYKIGSNTVISNTGGIIHSSFETANSDISSTQILATASDGAAYDYLGARTEIGFGRIVAAATGVDTTGSGSSSDSAGALYIFNFNGTQLKKIKPSDLYNLSQFGYSTNISNGRIVTSTRYSNDYGFSGYVYVFDLDGNQLAKFRHSDPVFSDRFGDACAAGCSRIVVGAWGADGNTSGSGAAYIFDLNGTQLAKISASDGANDDRFGYSVAVADGLIVVGAYGDDDNGSFSGSAYIFDLYGNQLAKIKPSDGSTNHYFGNHVSIGCGRIVVLSSGAGYAYIFDYNGKQIAKLTSVASIPKPFEVSDGMIAALQDVNYSLAVTLLDLNGSLINYFTPGSASGSVAFGEGRITVGYSTYDTTATDAGAVYIYKIPEDHNIYFGKILDSYNF